MNFLSLLDKLVEIVIKNKIRRHINEHCDPIAIHQHNFCKEKLCLLLIPLACQQIVKGNH